MNKSTKTIQIHKNLRLRKRKNSNNWQACLTIQGGKRMRRSTRTDDLEDAQEVALEIYYDVKARLKNKLPAQTRKFKHVADYAIKRMESELAEGTGKQAYKDYTSALRLWLIPFFGKVDVASIDLAALKNFEVWRNEKHGKPFSQSGINNHNAALNRVFDEAELHGWMVKSMRPTLLNKGKASVSRGSFTPKEYKMIYTALRTWEHQTDNAKAKATREVLRNYVLFLANTGVRHGTEALGLRWRNLAWLEKDGERYLYVNVDGKTKSRAAVTRDKVVDYLDRQSKTNTKLAHGSFEELVAAKSDEFVFTTRFGDVANIYSLNRAFNALLEQLDLKTGADGKSRTLYSLRHYYTNWLLQNGVSTHLASKQLGNSTA